jgi:spermidine/putrescine transport system substrate-binding protein
MATGDERMTEADGIEQLGMTRRRALARGAGGLLGVTAIGSALTALSDSAAAAASQTLTLLTYPQWYGPKELTGFAKAHSGVTVKTAVSGTTGQAAQIAQISTNPGAFDLTLAGVPVSSQLKLAKLLEPLDAGAVPNLKLVGAPFRKAFPYGIPTDFGKTGFAYRKDLMKERPASWHELWALAKKYSGKTTMIKYDSDIQGSVLRYLGHSINTTSQSQLQAMQNALLDIKPHLQAILETDYSKALIEGTAWMAIDYDYDIAAAQQHNKNIVWVAPKEGMAAYLEGWVALKGSKHLPLAWQLMNYHLDPRNYASFVNFTGTAFVEQSAQRYISKAIITNPSLRYDTSQLSRIEFEQYLGPQQTAYRGRLWEEFLAA